MPAPATSFPALAGLLKEQTSLLGELQDLLAREARALASARQDEILGLADDKQRLGTRLAELSLELDGLLQDSAPSPNEVGPGPDLGGRLSRLVGEAPDGTGLAALHQRALEALGACLADNRIVGVLVERRRSAVERALRIFFDGPEGTNLYQASGRLHTASPNNHLIGEA
jgi:flagellar biosynthesis/type III secretory pathway chaperone